MADETKHNDAAQAMKVTITGKRWTLDVECAVEDQWGTRRGPFQIVNADPSMSDEDIIAAIRAAH